MVSPQVGITPTLPLFIIDSKSHGKEILLDEGRGDSVYGSVVFASYQQWTKRFAFNAAERTICCLGGVPGPTAWYEGPGCHWYYALLPLAAQAVQPSRSPRGVAIHGW